MILAASKGEKTKEFKGFHGNMENAYSLMKGLEIYYNFVKKYEVLKGKCPYELVCPELKLGVTKWLDLIKVSHE